MSKPRLRDLIAAKKATLRASPPQSRERIRQRLNVLAMCQVLRKKGRAA